MIRQGYIYWIDVGVPEGSESGYLRPHVVVQSNALNDSQIRTVIVCPLTTTLRRANDQGNVVLNAGEGGLSKQSIVMVAQVGAVDRSQFGDFIGRLSPARVRQIVAGVRLCIEPAELNESGEE